MSQPIRKFQVGAIAVALWKNNANVNGRVVPMLKCTVERRYRDGDGNWKSSGSFSRGELPQVQLCLSNAYEAMWQPVDEGQQPQVEEEVIE